MEEHEYNWEIILKISAPVSLVVAYVFYTGISDFAKWSVMALGIMAAGGITYSKDKKKGDIFTAMAVVLLAAVLTMLLRRAGII